MADGHSSLEDGGKSGGILIDQVNTSRKRKESTVVSHPNSPPTPCPLHKKNGRKRGVRGLHHIIGCRSGGLAELPGDSDVAGGGGWWAADKEGTSGRSGLEVAATIMPPCLPICPSPSLPAPPKLLLQTACWSQWWRSTWSSFGISFHWLVFHRCFISFFCLWLNCYYFSFIDLFDDTDTDSQHQSWRIPDRRCWHYLIKVVQLLTTDYLIKR